MCDTCPFSRSKGNRPRRRQSTTVNRGRPSERRERFVADTGHTRVACSQVARVPQRTTETRKGGVCPVGEHVPERDIIFSLALSLLPLSHRFNSVRRPKKTGMRFVYTLFVLYARVNRHNRLARAVPSEGRFRDLGPTSGGGDGDGSPRSRSLQPGRVPPRTGIT